MNIYIRLAMGGVLGWLLTAVGFNFTYWQFWALLIPIIICFMIIEGLSESK